MRDPSLFVAGSAPVPASAAFSERILVSLMPDLGLAGIASAFLPTCLPWAPPRPKTRDWGGAMTGPGLLQIVLVVPARPADHSRRATRRQLPVSPWARRRPRIPGLCCPGGWMRTGRG